MGGQALTVSPAASQRPVWQHLARPARHARGPKRAARRGYQGLDPQNGSAARSISSIPGLDAPGGQLVSACFLMTLPTVLAEQPTSAAMARRDLPSPCRAIIALSRTAVSALALALASVGTGR